MDGDHLLLRHLQHPLPGGQPPPLRLGRLGRPGRPLALVADDDPGEDPATVKSAPGWCVGAYILLLFATLPAAWPVWTGFLRDRIGRFLTVEQIHLIQYGVLGLLGALWVLSSSNPKQTLLRMASLGAAVGLLDEGIQGLLPERYFQWSDVALNWGGVSLALVPTWVALRARRRNRAIAPLTGTPPGRPSCRRSAG